MKSIVALSFLCAIFPASAQQLTYWVDQSCRIASGNRFQKAFDDALTIARRGNMRLHSNTDTDQEALFTRIFKTIKTDAQSFGRVNQVLGMPAVPPTPPWGIAGMIPEPNNDRRAANFRYYCDDDPQSIDGGTRWTLRPDPNPLPQGYVAQRQRPRASDPLRQPGQAYQEWEDIANGIIMGNSGGCQDVNTQAETFTRFNTANGQLQGQPNVRATVTLCQYQLNSIINSFGSIPLKKDITDLTRNGDNLGRTGLDAFACMTSMVLLHEACHLPPLDVEDLDSPNPRGNHITAYGWHDVQDLRTTGESLNNADNFVYFAILARLADRHFRLSMNENEAHDGKLLYDLHGITSKSRMKERMSKVKVAGRDTGWWNNAWKTWVA